MFRLSRALEQLYRLNVGVIGTGEGRHERPHKPCLLLAVLDEIEMGRASPLRVEWNESLRAAFARYFEAVRSANDSCTPENPFFYLKSDGFWEPFRLESTDERPLEGPPSVGDASSGFVYARFTVDWTELVTDQDYRIAMRDAITARYFPSKRTELIKLFTEYSVPDANVAEDAGRSGAFRRQILENYDYQCCACGLRIWIAERELTFVDAAHLVPFSEGRNDHPTNGIALCKNHHWAMDQRLLAPDPDRVWRVSREIDPRRSKGEEEISRIGGQRMLLPAEPAYAPDVRGLAWRHSRLKAL